MSEKERLDLVIERDGLEAAIKFAEQGLYLYIIEALKRSGALGESTKEWVKFLEAQGKKVRLVVVE